MSDDRLPMPSSIRDPTSLSHRVYEFEKMAKWMIRKLDVTREQIQRCTDGPDAVEHLKLSISPDAATLISQGDTLVLETHGKSTELSGTVMLVQSQLRDKFREMKCGRMAKGEPQSAVIASDDSQKLSNISAAPNQNVPKENKCVDKQLLSSEFLVAGSPNDKVIQEIVCFVVESIDGLNGGELEQRVARIQVRDIVCCLKFHNIFFRNRNNI